MGRLPFHLALRILRPMKAAAIESGGESSASLDVHRPSYLLVGNLPPPAHGSALSFEMLYRELSDRGYHCKVVDVMRKKESPPSQLSLTRSFEVCAAIVKFFAALVNKHRRVYIIISQSWAGFIRDMLMIWLAQLFNCFVVVQLRGGNYDGFYVAQPWLRRLCIRLTLRRVNRIIALSEQLRQMYLFDPRLTQRVAVVANGPPISLPAKPRKWEDRQGRRPIRLLYLSNLIQSKGYSDVLEAAAILRRKAAPFELVFAGRFLSSVDDDASMPPELAEAHFRHRIESKGLSDAVRYMGPVMGKRKWRQFETSDFFLLPTRYQHEGQPVSIIEAMAYGCVVIATKFRSIPEMVLDGKTGVLVDYGQPEQIAQAVLRIADDPQTYAAMSKAAVEHYERHFTLEKHMDAMISVLDAT